MKDRSLYKVGFVTLGLVVTVALVAVFLHTHLSALANIGAWLSGVMSGTGLIAAVIAIIIGQRNASPLREEERRLFLCSLRLREAIAFFILAVEIAGYLEDAQCNFEDPRVQRASNYLDNTIDKSLDEGVLSLLQNIDAKNLGSGLEATHCLMLLWDMLAEHTNNPSKPVSVALTGSASGLYRYLDAVDADFISEIVRNPKHELGKETIDSRAEKLGIAIRLK